MKKRKKQEKNKETEKDIWDKLRELNKEFKDITEHKKKNVKKNTFNVNNFILVYYKMCMIKLIDIYLKLARRMSYCSLLTGKLYKEKEEKKLKNFFCRVCW